MALINCPECKKEVSDTLNNCIHCGYNLKVETDNSGNTDNYDKNINKKSKVIIHGYEEFFIVNPNIKIYVNDNLIYSLPKGESYEYDINETTKFTFKCNGRKAEVTAYPNGITEIRLIFNRATGQLQAICNDQRFDGNNNVENQRKYEQTVAKKKNNSLIWLLIGIVLLIIGILL